MQEPTLIYGLAAVAQMFAVAKEQSRAAFMPYYPIGYPDYATSLDAIMAMAEAGADGFEIGIPFSDPLADGSVIQAATQKALENGITVCRCLDAVRELRTHGLRQPLLLMSYLNPLLSYGLEKLTQDAKIAGADGFVIPDLPPEESTLFEALCIQAGLALVFFLAPTSNSARIALISQRARGFIYLVSVTGVTGVRSALPPDLSDFIARVRAQTNLPLAVGFGISQPKHARVMSALADGVIIGSALVKAGGVGIEAVRDLAFQLRAAL